MPSSGVATVYADCAYAGQSTALPVGTYTLAQLQALGVDNVSSVQVQSGYVITLYADNNFLGSSVAFTANDDCLVNNNFNDLITSVRVAAVTPAITIQAENYNIMSGVTKETCTDTGGGQNLGSMDLNDWVVYDNINIPTNGTYTVQYRVASLNGGAQLQLERGGGSVIYGTVNIPSTGGWQSWTTIQHTVNLTAGVQSFGIKGRASGGNLNWFSIRARSGARESQVAAEGMEEMVSAYPSPATDWLYVDTGVIKGTSDIDIFTPDGRLAYKTKAEGARAEIRVANINTKGLVLVKWQILAELLP